MQATTDFLRLPLNGSVLFTYDGVERGNTGGRHLGVRCE